MLSEFFLPSLTISRFIIKRCIPVSQLKNPLKTCVLQHPLHWLSVFSPLKWPQQVKVIAW